MVCVLTYVIVLAYFVQSNLACAFAKDARIPLTPCPVIIESGCVECGTQNPDQA
jgi:hypothetical protein